MALIFTDGKDLIAGGKIYKSKDGYASVPDEIAAMDGLVEAKEKKKKSFKIEGVSENA